MKKDVLFIAGFIVFVLMICAIVAFVLIQFEDVLTGKTNSDSKKGASNKSAPISVKTLTAPKTNPTLSAKNNISEEKVAGVSGACNDSDVNSQFTDGQNYLSPGKTCVGNNCKMDSCINQRDLLEYYCSGREMRTVNFTCQLGYYCKQEFFGSAYCTSPVKNITLGSDMSKIRYNFDIKRNVLFYATAEIEPLKVLPFSVYLTMHSDSSGKYKVYDEKPMLLNKLNGRYELSVPVKSLETYQEPMTNLSVEAVAKTDGVIISRSKPKLIVITWSE